MKKLVIISAIIIITLCLFKSESIAIPKEAIRFRVIANSNSSKDQEIKKTVVNNLKHSIKNLTLIPKDITNSRNEIKKSLPMLHNSIKNTLQELNVEEDYTIKYGMNYFPEKEYKGVKYEAGEYESVVVTLGNGLGDNFWCILFPPLCLLEGEETTTDEIEYTSFVKELIKKYF